MAANATKSRSPDRAQTEQALEDAAIRLVEREGVLSGLNLQRVADEAGVNRGLVYHYFGSRRDLLRKALRRNAMAWGANLGAFLALSRRERARAFLQAMIQYPRTAKLVLLLAIDGDRTFRMVDARATVDQGEAPQAEGDVASDVDEAALFTILASFVFAYAVRRTAFAREFGVPVKELDGRVEQTLLRLIDGL